MASIPPKTIHQIIATYDVSEALISTCYDRGLISSETVFYPRDEIRIRLVKKGLALGFSMSDLVFVINKTPTSLLGKS